MGEISKVQSVRATSKTGQFVQSALAKAINSQHPIAVANVTRLRRLHPKKSPKEMVQLLDKYYLATVSATGTGAGMAAVIPNGAVQIPVALADLASYLEFSVLYTLSVAEVHGVDVEDYERRAVLVTLIMLGNSASTQLLEKAIGRTAPHLGKLVVNSIPATSLAAINKVLGRHFVTKYGSKAGLLVLGKQVPLFIGAAIGGIGNGLFGLFIIKSAQKALGTPPKKWPAPAATKSLKAAKPKSTAK